MNVNDGPAEMQMKVGQSGLEYIKPSETLHVFKVFASNTCHGRPHFISSLSNLKGKFQFILLFNEQAFKKTELAAQAEQYHWFTMGLPAGCHRGFVAKTTTGLLD